MGLPLIAALVVLLVAILGLVLVWVMWRRSRRAALGLVANAEKQARRVLARAEIDGERLRKDVEIVARERLLAARTEFERETRDQRLELFGLETTLEEKGTEIDRRSSQVAEREQAMAKLEEELRRQEAILGATQRRARVRPRRRAGQARADRRTDDRSGQTGTSEIPRERGAHGRRQSGPEDRGGVDREGQGEGPSGDLHGHPTDRVGARGREHRFGGRSPVGRDEGTDHRPRRSEHPGLRAGDRRRPHRRRHPRGRHSVVLRAGASRDRTPCPREPDPGRSHPPRAHRGARRQGQGGDGREAPRRWRSRGSGGRDPRYPPRDSQAHRSAAVPFVLRSERAQTLHGGGVARQPHGGRTRRQRGGRQARRSGPRHRQGGGSRDGRHPPRARSRDAQEISAKPTRSSMPWSATTATTTRTRSRRSW